MNRKQAQEIRIRRAMMVIAKNATQDDWERIAEVLEKEAVRISTGAPQTINDLPDWFES